MHYLGQTHTVAVPLPVSGVGDSIGLTEAMVRFAARFEYARTVEDMLARRSRLLFLDAKLAGALADGARALHDGRGQLGVGRIEAHGTTPEPSLMQ